MRASFNASAAISELAALSTSNANFWLDEISLELLVTVGLLVFCGRATVFGLIAVVNEEPGATTPPSFPDVSNRISVMFG